MKVYILATIAALLASVNIAYGATGKVQCASYASTANTSSYTIGVGSLGCINTKKIDVTVTLEYKTANTNWLPYNYVRRVTMRSGYVGRVKLQCRPSNSRKVWKFRTRLNYTAYGKAGFASFTDSKVSYVSSYAC